MLARWVKGEEFNLRVIKYMKLEMCNDIIRSMPTPGSASSLLFFIFILVLVSRGESCNAAFWPLIASGNLGNLIDVIPNYNLDFNVNSKGNNNQTNHAIEVPIKRDNYI